ncbi:MAG: flavin monoamine oxidase family protein [Pseudomonadota bacterium]
MRSGGALWRALETARRRNCADAGEAAPAARAAGATRRGMLQAMAAAGVFAAMPRSARAFPGGRVAIIGGGMAGLSALHHLREAGVDARLYEARGRMGGRMFTRRPPDGGPAFEDGAQLINTDHADMHALAARYGTALIDRKAAAHRSLILADGGPLSDDRLAQALRPIAEQIGRDADRLDRDYARVAPALDRLSIADYLDRHADLLGPPWVRQLLEGTSRTEYGVEPDCASAIELIFNLPTVAGERVDVLGGSDERFVIEGGSSALVDAMAAAHAGRIETGRRLLRIARADGRLRLTFADGSVVAADRVIVAVPAPILRQIDYEVPLHPLWRDYAGVASLGLNEKIQVAAATRPWAAAMGPGGDLWETSAGAGFASGWDGSVQRGDGTVPVWTWYLGGAQVAEGALSAEALSRRFGALADAAIPGMAAMAGQVRRTAWHRDPLTLGGYVNFAPGQLSRYGGLLWREGEDGVHSGAQADVLFAGEHLSDAFPGYMNGAAQTGRLAAWTITGDQRLRRAA